MGAQKLDKKEQPGKKVIGPASTATILSSNTFWERAQRDREEQLRQKRAGMSRQNLAAMLYLQVAGDHGRS